ncbi:MAG: hypothetical protein IPG78_19475 [Ignavibacteria bacterium]|nr:hypothetical protein [Ignavibacteria bacterium]
MNCICHCSTSLTSKRQWTVLEFIHRHFKIANLTGEEFTWIHVAAGMPAEPDEMKLKFKILPQEICGS